MRASSGAAVRYLTAAQTGLFDATSIPGLAYRPALVSADEERALVDALARLEFAPFQFQGWLGNRRVVSFGWRYDFNDARLNKAPPLPGFLEPLRGRVAAFAGLAEERFAQTLVTEYPPGAGIGWHRDRPVFDIVVGVSLLAPCTLRFRRARPDGFERVSLFLEPRSAYALAGPARHDWEHSIAPMKALRYSVTFRSMKPAGPKRVR